MADRVYLTVPEELLTVADAVADRYEEFGYSVRVEHRELGYPYTPTLDCLRNSAALVIVEVDLEVKMDRLREWAGYGRSCSTDTRIVAAVRTNPVEADLARLDDLGVGLLICTEDRIVESMAAQDLAVNVKLPRLNRFSNEVRRLLGPVYEQFARGQWREGFEDACKVVEDLGRSYLSKHLSSGRIEILDKAGRKRNLSAAEIDRMTLGALANAFGGIRIKNRTDTLAAQVLSQINDDRIGVVHKKWARKTEENLRKNVGQHMWTVVRAVDELHRNI